MLTRDEVLRCLQHAVRECERESLSYKVEIDSLQVAINDVRRKAREIEREKEQMSAKIWMDIRDAVREVGTPEQAKEFELCRDRNSICEFLNKYFSLEDQDWSTQVMVQTPDILRKEFHK